MRSVNSVLDFKNFLGNHLGVRHLYSDLPSEWREYSELEKLGFLPLVFYVIPNVCIFGRGKYAETKPAIRDHLDNIAVPWDETFVTLIKILSDNLWSSSSSGQLGTQRRAGISDLRQKKKLYNFIKGRQGNRCRVCGVAFDDAGVETLDHIIPWRLGGDPGDGDNWQILCDACNSSKSDFLTALMMPESQNWIYRSIDSFNNVDYDFSPQTRYSVLSSQSTCSQEGCKNTSRQSRLHVRLKSQTGLPVHDNLIVYCSDHVDSEINF